MAQQTSLFPEDGIRFSIEPDSIEEFREMIYSFYRDHRRSMPWREEIDPYRVLISELMLQQTQVRRVIDKFPSFIRRFPDFDSLARASFEEVLREWQGLGYNRRAKFLHNIAGIIVDTYGGILPDQPSILIRFPGIGIATAGSITAFAYNLPVVFIETNIRRVFIHHFFLPHEEVSDSAILPLISASLDQSSPREWYYALMDYGAWLGVKIENPNRRSSHYTRQSSFSGSDRQIRGLILRLLLQNGIMSDTDLISALDENVERINLIIRGLIQDELVYWENNMLSIK